MTDPNDISEDRGFKDLFTSYPIETVEVFCPEAWRQRGRPVSVIPLQQEIPPPNLGDASRHLDMALMATWADGSQGIILLVEHWSDAGKVCLRRTQFYVAGLDLRHPDVPVWPVILVTDRSAREIPDRLEMMVCGELVMSFKAQVVRVTEADLPRLRSLQNRVASVLLALAASDLSDAVEAVAEAFTHMAQAPGKLTDLQHFLPFLMKLARMPISEQPRLWRRLQETPNMVTFLDEMIAEGVAKGEAKGEARGEARGKAEGKAEAGRAAVEALRRLVLRGVLSIDAAKAEIQEMIATGALTTELGEEALIKLG